MGNFNKFYEISHTNRSKEYIFKFPLPVFPKLKTESEVATTGFMRKITDLVPRIATCCKQQEIDVGIEWMIMEKMPGMPLRKMLEKDAMGEEDGIDQAIGSDTSEIVQPPYYRGGQPTVIIYDC